MIDEGIQIYDGLKAKSVSSTSVFQSVFTKVSVSHGRGDAALVAFSKATGYEAVTMERRLYNFVTNTLNSDVPIRRIF